MIFSGKNPILILLVCLGIFIPTAELRSQSDTIDYSLNKIFPEELREVTLRALSRYPELYEAKIKFRYRRHLQGAFMQAQPAPLTLLKQKKDRVYIITMTSALIIDDRAIPLQELPEDVLTGWLAHELGHVLDYHNRRWFEMMFFGVAYFFSDGFKIKAERNADIYAIEHGFGNEIIATKNFILEQSAFPEFYKQKIREIYMSPEEVLDLVQEDLDDLEDVDEELEERGYGD